VAERELAVEGLASPAPAVPPGSDAVPAPSAISRRRTDTPDHEQEGEAKIRRAILLRRMSFNGGQPGGRALSRRGGYRARPALDSGQIVGCSYKGAAYSAGRPRDRALPGTHGMDGVGPIVRTAQ
jgi:hypothetical protein